MRRTSEHTCSQITLGRARAGRAGQDMMDSDHADADDQAPGNASHGKDNSASGAVSGQQSDGAGAGAGDVVSLAPRCQPKPQSTPSSPPTFAASTPARVSFDRRELNALLDLYGRRVAEGEWRDYAIDFHTDRAIFSIFRRTSEAPLYRIEKQPRLTRRQGAWSVVSAAGLVLKRGNDLSRILAVLEKPLRVVRG